MIGPWKTKTTTGYDEDGNFYVEIEKERQVEIDWSEDDDYLLDEPESDDE